MKILGIDPDTKNSGLAVVEFNGVLPKVIWTGVAHAKGNYVHDRLWKMALEMTRLRRQIEKSWSMKTVVIEWQALRPHGEKNPNSIVDLNAVAGMCLQEFSNFHRPVLTPTPPKWKGQVPKDIHQKRIMSKVTVESVAFEQFTKTRQGHVIDAIGLALWGHAQIIKSRVYEA